MVRVKQSILSLFSVLFFTQALLASELDIKTELSNSLVEIGDRVILSVSIISSEKQVNIDDNTMSPSVKGLEFLNRSQSSSSNMRFGGGQKVVTFTKTLNFFFTPTVQGRIRIPPFDIFVDGKKMRTKPVILEVVKELKAEQKAQKNRNKRRGSPFDIFGSDDDGDDIINRFFRGFRSDTKPEKPEFFVDAEVENLTPFEGEQFLVKWYVYTNGALSQFDTLKFPTLKGFWKEDVEFAQNFRWQRAEKDGKMYRRALMTSYALTPYNEGSLKIDSFDLRATVSSTSFGFGKPKVFRVKSKEYDIKVKPLPEPQPEFFNGGVGNFTFELEKFPSVVRVADTFTVKIRIKGNASNVKFLKDIKLDLGDDFELYEETENVKFFPNRLSYVKQISFLIIPKKEGVFSIPDLRLNYFDTQSEDYKSIYNQFPVLKVVPGADALNVPTDVILQADESENKSLETLGDYEYLKEETFTAKLIRPVYFLSLFPFWLILFVLLAVSLFLVLKKVSEESFIDILESESREIKSLLSQAKNKEALDKMINMVSFGVGAISGKRYGVEQRLKDSLDMLPTSLADYKNNIISLNSNLQDIRFAKIGSENKSKVEACHEEFLNFKQKVVDYLSKD